ncbi:antitoxin PaaA2 family protein [Gellertiella hungarica]|uniref:Stability determinant domain-containing protein n=1 Tax=Gellertiella hungarica TaxID=1572859 RepID=A0A7W6J699_9HYPH|nr:hypothetical protein [Gellertiella hungarica]MBB4064713.1 hypothetical protein [Gellertiella hungarica]
MSKAAAKPDGTGEGGDTFAEPETLSWDEERQVGDDWLNDADYAAHVRAAIEKALDDPRPTIPLDEVRRRMEAKLLEVRRTWRP